MGVSCVSPSGFHLVIVFPLSKKGDGMNTLPLSIMFQYFDLARMVHAFLNTWESMRLTASALKSYPVLTLWMPYSIPSMLRYSS